MTEFRDDAPEIPVADSQPPAQDPPVAAIGGVRLRRGPIRRRSRNRDDSKDLGFAWVVTALGGFALIHFGGTSSSVVRALLPVGAMAGYLVFGLSRETRNMYRLGDSVYFLGFLWTLFALIDTLIGRGTEVSAADVFTVFGYALVTTAAGMFLRLALVQFQRTPGDVVSDVQDEIDGRLASLVKSLRTASSGVDELAAKLAESATRIDSELTNLVRRFEAIELPEKMLSKEVERIGKEMSDAAATFKERLAESGDAVEGRVSTLFAGLSKLPAQQDVEALAAQLNQSAAALKREYGDLHRVVDSVGQRAAAVDRGIERLETAFGRVAANVDVVDRSAGRIQRALAEVLAFVVERTNGGRREGGRYSQD